MARAYYKYFRFFSPRLRTKTFLRLAFLFFVPLVGVSVFFLYRQYETLQERLHFSFLTRADLLAGRIENLLKDRIAPVPGHPLLLASGVVERAGDLPGPAALHATIGQDHGGSAEFLFVFVVEGSPRILYVRTEQTRFRFYVFRADFLAEFIFESRLLTADESFFLINQGGSPAFSNLVAHDLSVPIGWLPHLDGNPGNPFVAGEERIVTVDDTAYLFSTFPFPGLPMRVAIARPLENAFAPLKREMTVQALFLGAVLLAFLGYSLFAANEQIRPLLVIEEFLRRVSNRDFDFVPRIRTRDERRAIFKSLNRLRLKLRRFDRLNAQELAERNRRLEELNETKNHLLGTAAHDLRNPLGVIQGFASFLLEEASDRLEPEHRLFLERIRASSESMLNLVNDLLDIARIEAGALELHLVPTDVREVVRNVVELNRVLAVKKKIEIEEEYESAPFIPLDTPRMEQVLNNLIGNAMKFSEPGTRIFVSVRLRQGNLAVAVRDQGQGIPREELQKIFHPFVVSASTRATAGEGSTGLGLAIVKKIVQGHGGTITVDSEVGSGSEFSVILPL